MRRRERRELTLAIWRVDELSELLETLSLRWISWRVGGGTAVGEVPIVCKRRRAG
jgi:hypothetical protein